jgi:hypothetical protein
MKRQLNAWLSCSPEERFLLGRAWLLLLGITIALRVLPLPRIQSLLRRPRSGQANSTIKAERLAWIVGVAARRHLWSVSCLEKSLVLEALLVRYGFSPELKIGVRREDGVLQAHAWVEVEGHPVGESPNLHRRFLPVHEALPE